jgi:phage shock protein E
MDWHPWIIVGGAAAVFVLLKRLTLVRPDVARDWLKKGAKVIDVRSEGEFRGGHLPGTLNIPLDQLSAEIGRHAANKDQALLLHCLSGTRSGMGKSRLRKLGYRHVFNLGSYERAGQILSSRQA